MNTQHYQLKQPSRITRFLWWCAGADPHFMNDSPMQDRVKYAGIGGIVFATGLMAVFAGYVAFDLAFGPKVMATQEAPGFNWLAGVFSIFWGMVIFNLYRLIVSSTGKGDGTDKITWAEYKKAIPNILIAFVIAYTIYIPLGLKIIESEINVELGMKQEKILVKLDSLTKNKFTVQIALIDADIKKLEGDRDKLVSDLKGAEKEYIDQMQGRSGQGFGYGPRAKQLNMLMNEKRKEIDQFDTKNKNTLGRLKADREKKLSEQDHELNVENKKRVVKLDGLLERIRIAIEIGYWLGWTLYLIVVSILVGPIYVMMMTKLPQ
jgi:hypothetical protein